MPAAPRHDFIAQLAELLRGRGATGRVPAPASVECAGPRRRPVEAQDRAVAARGLPGGPGGSGPGHPGHPSTSIPPRCVDRGERARRHRQAGDAGSRRLRNRAVHLPGRRAAADPDVSGESPARRRNREGRRRGAGAAPVGLPVRRGTGPHATGAPRRRDAGRGRPKPTSAAKASFSACWRTSTTARSPRSARRGSAARYRRLCERRLISGAGRRLTEAEEEIEKKHGVSKDNLAATGRHAPAAPGASPGRRILRAEPRHPGRADSALAKESGSHGKGRIRGRHRCTPGGATLAPWWVLTGRRELCSATGTTGHGVSPSQPARQERPRSGSWSCPRPDSGPSRNSSAVRSGSREGYGAMMFAAEDVGRRYPELSEQVQQLRSDITGEFNRATRPEPSRPRTTTSGAIVAS